MRILGLEAESFRSRVASASTQQMDTPQDHDQALLDAGGTPAALIRNKERITRMFAERVRQMLDAAQRQSQPMTVNTLPAFLTSLAIALCPSSSRSFASEDSGIAFAHGNERARLSSYSLAQLIREYQILREILADVLPAETTLAAEEWSIVHRSIDEAIGGAASAFVEVHQGVRERFTATLTHDFRGPLGAAMNYLELIRRAGDKPEQRAHFAARALDNLKRLDGMIDDVLDASRAHGGEPLVLNPTECDLRALAREVLDELSLQQGNRFTLHCNHEIPAFGDCERLRQALYNLLQNALKYGSPEAPITVRLLDAHGRAMISVHNFGDPIPPEDMAVLFQLYGRTSSAERSGKKGWGLGLVLVQAIAEAHGGTVTVESNAQEGTTFTLDILQDVRRAERHERLQR